MDLILRTYAHLSWQARTFRHVLVNVPFATAVGTSALVTAYIAQILAFFLPLKVIIILSSGHLPRYVAFLGVEGQTQLIIGFTVATFLLYALSISLSTLAGRVIARGSDRLFQLQKQTSNLPRASKKHLSRHYAALCRSHADAAVAALGGLTIALINPAIFICMAMIVLIQIAATGWVLRNERGGFLAWLKNGIRKNSGIYLQSLGALNFLAVFVLLLADYLMTGSLNIISGLLTLILGRMTFSSLAKFAKRAVPLSKDQADIDDLLIVSPR